MIAFDSLLMKFSHQTNSTTAKFRSPNSIEGKCLIDLLTTKHVPYAKRKTVFCHRSSGSLYTDSETIGNKKAPE